MVGSFAPSRTRVWNWSQYTTYLTPCLKPDVAVFELRTFDCVRLAQGIIFGWVRLSSITELNRSPNRTTGVRLGSTTECSISRPGNRYQNKRPIKEGEENAQATRGVRYLQAQLFQFCLVYFDVCITLSLFWTILQILLNIIWCPQSSWGYLWPVEAGWSPYLPRKKFQSRQVMSFQNLKYFKLLIMEDNCQIDMKWSPSHGKKLLNIFCTL